MYFKSCATACAGAALGLAIASFGSGALAADMRVRAVEPPKPPPFFLVNDNAFTYSYAPTATDPFVGKTAKNIFTFSHFDVWAYGTNFFNVDLLKSDIRDPATPCGYTGFPATGCEGATEIYGFFRSTLGWKQLYGIQFGTFLTNISWKFGGDANTENNVAAPAKRDVVAGLQFDFALPWGASADISGLYYAEKNHNGLVFNPSSGVKYFKSTWRVESGFRTPLGPKGTPWSFSSVAGINGPKGTGVGTLVGNPGAGETKVEYFFTQKIALDVGQVVANKPGMVSVFVAYVYWQNKFGIDHTQDPTGGSTESTWLFGATAAF
jgi:hypothetical protein